MKKIEVCTHCESPRIFLEIMYLKDYLWGMTHMFTCIVLDIRFIDKKI